MFSSVSGDINMKYEKLDGDFTMKCVSGDAELMLPKNSEFEVIAKTISGDVECEFPLTVIGTRKKGRLRGQVGSDAFTIAATTTSGDLNISRY
jgi:lia operon protein LiaG